MRLFLAYLGSFFYGFTVGAALGLLLKALLAMSVARATLTLIVLGLVWKFRAALIHALVKLPVRAMIHAYHWLRAPVYNITRISS